MHEGKLQEAYMSEQNNENAQHHNQPCIRLYVMRSYDHLKGQRSLNNHTNMKVVLDSCGR